MNAYDVVETLLAGCQNDTEQRIVLRSAQVTGVLCVEELVELRKQIDFPDSCGWTGVPLEQRL